MSQPIVLCLDPKRKRSEIIHELRRLLPSLEGVSAERRVFPLGLPELDEYLPQGGLPSGALHEIVPETEGDIPSAFGFLIALLGRLPETGPVLFVTAPRGLAEYGRPHGHGLNNLGLNPSRLILVETGEERQALWAVEEALRSGAPAVVAAAIGKTLDLKTSRRLHLAAAGSGLSLLLLQTSGTVGTSAAVTRWCIAAAKAARDPYDLIESWRWRVRLERCRNGRSGEWLVEWNHAAYRFGLAAAVADLALPSGTNSWLRARRAGRS